MGEGIGDPAGLGGATLAGQRPMRRAMTPSDQGQRWRQARDREAAGPGAGRCTVGPDVHVRQHRQPRRQN
jgi:hypothetical protein